MKEIAGMASLLVLLASCATGQAGEPASVDLTLLTWNILHGANDEGDLNLEAKGRYISIQAADLVFLQEIDENCERSGSVDQMAILGQITGMDAAFGSFMPYQGGRYGLGTLSSLPVRSTRSLRLPEGDEPRVALFREVEVLGPSWNARAPSVDIDHILVRSGSELTLEPLGGEVQEESLLSDHRPVRGRVRVLRSPHFLNPVY